MPIDDPDVSDPMELTGIEIPDADGSATREMARCFVEEFARMGYEAGDILDLFEDPRYGSAHAALVRLGTEEVRRIAEEAVRPWRGFRSARAEARARASGAVDAARRPRVSMIDGWEV